MAKQIPAIAAADGIAITFPVCMISDVASSTGSGSTLIFVTASVGIVAAFAAIEEIQTIIEMRIDRKKIFLALSDFPIDTLPPILFPNMSM